VVILAMEESGVSHENHHPWTGNWQTLSRHRRLKHTSSRSM